MFSINKNASTIYDFDSCLNIVVQNVHNEYYTVDIGLVRIKIIKRPNDVIFLSDRGDTTILWGSSVWSLVSLLHNDFEVAFTTTRTEDIYTTHTHTYTTFCYCGDSLNINKRLIESMMWNSQVRMLYQRQQIEDLYE